MEKYRVKRLAQSSPRLFDRITTTTERVFFVSHSSVCNLVALREREWVWSIHLCYNLIDNLIGQVRYHLLVVRSHTDSCDRLNSSEIIINVEDLEKSGVKEAILIFIIQGIFLLLPRKSVLQFENILYIIISRTLFIYTLLNMDWRSGSYLWLRCANCSYRNISCFEMLSVLSVTEERDCRGSVIFSFFSLGKLHFRNIIKS